MLGEVGLLFGDRGVVAVRDNGGLVGILAKLRLAFDLYVGCEVGVFSFDQRFVRRSFAPAPGESVTTCGIFCFNLVKQLNI
jgi:hypothetical protein